MVTNLRWIDFLFILTNTIYTCMYLCVGLDTWVQGPKEIRRRSWTPRTTDVGSVCFEQNFGPLQRLHEQYMLLNA